LRLEGWNDRLFFRRRAWTGRRRRYERLRVRWFAECKQRNCNPQIAQIFADSGKLHFS